VHLRRWAGYFAKLGHRIAILSMSENADPLPGTKIIRLHSLNYRNELKKMEIFFWLCWFRPDIFHIHWGTFGALTRKSRLCPFGITIWGSEIYKMDKLDPNIRDEMLNAFKAANFITCDSNDLKRKISQLAGTNKKVHLIQWGIDTELFSPGLDETTWRERFDIHDNAKVILSMRNINPIYQTETIIEAFSEVAQKRKDVILIQKYYSADLYRLEALKKLVKNKGLEKKVKWIGTLPYEKLPFIYNMADLVVSVPSSDGTPMCLLEAMACGVPPIVSDVPSVLEWIENGVNGLVVPIGDADALSKAIMHILENRAFTDAVAQKNLQMVRTKASQKVHMAKMESTYKSISRSHGHYKRIFSDVT